MAQEQSKGRSGRLSRRAALRAGATIGAVGAGLAVGAAGTMPGVASAAPAGWRREHLEVEFTPVNAASVVRAGSGPPQRGDTFYVDAPIYPVGQVGARQIGEYQCFGAWTNLSSDTGARDLRLTTVQFHLFGRGIIMGLINEGGAAPSDHIGAVQGGTGAFIGALGIFRQVSLSGGTTGVTAGQQVVRGLFDLILPDLG